MVCKSNVRPDLRTTVVVYASKRFADPNDVCEVLAQPDDDLQLVPLPLEGAARQQVRRLHGHKMAGGGRAQLEVKLEGAQVVLRNLGQNFLKSENNTFDYN